MEIVKPQHHTRTLGEAQGYRPLLISDRLNDEDQQVMVSIWKPSLFEIEQIAAGMPVRLIVRGVSHPPVIIDVGEVEAKDLEMPT